MTGGRRVLVVVVMFALAGCYLPSASNSRPLSSQVQVPVYRCTAERVGGDILNNADVPIVISIKAKWMDNQSAVFHEVEVGPFEVDPKGSIEWEALAGEEVDLPALCQAETVEVIEGET
jgi:hypothetical protein